MYEKANILCVGYLAPVKQTIKDKMQLPIKNTTSTHEGLKTLSDFKSEWEHKFTNDKDVTITSRCKPIPPLISHLKCKYLTLYLHIYILDTVLTYTYLLYSFLFYVHIS